jgi:hypothetical protein
VTQNGREQVAGLRLAVRYLRIVRPVPRLARLSFLVITAWCAAALWVADATRPHLLWPVLLLQAFTVSTGFMNDARRGHFDVLFTAGARPVVVALVYWVLAALPGVVCWLALAGVERMRHGSTLFLTGGTVAVMWLVSVVPWAATVALPRFTGAIGWLLAFVSAGALTPLGEGSFGLTTATGAETWWGSATALLLFPPRLVGHTFGAESAGTVLVLGVTGALLLGALAWVARADVPLESGQ